MQLTIEVLPAPLGPMIENNSPDLTPKLTSVSARTPPKRSETPRTSNVCSNRPSRLPAYAAFRALVGALGRYLFLTFQRDPISAPPAKPCDQRHWLGAGISDAIQDRAYAQCRLGRNDMHRVKPSCGMSFVRQFASNFQDCPWFICCVATYR